MPLNKKAGVKRLVDMTMPIPAWAPELPGEEPPWEQDFPLSAVARYTEVLFYDERGRLVEWVIIQARLVDGAWCRVAVYDLRHGKGVHVHRYDRDGQEFSERPLMSVDSYEDVETGLDLALRQVADYWEENERRSDRGR